MKNKVYIVISLNKKTGTDLAIETLEIFSDEKAAVGRAEAIAHYAKLLHHNSTNDLTQNNNCQSSDVQVILNNKDKYVAICTSYQNKDVIEAAKITAGTAKKAFVEHYADNTIVDLPMQKNNQITTKEPEIDLPAGWDLNNKPILESQVKLDPWYVKLILELSDQQRKALVIARIKKSNNNYTIYLPCVGYVNKVFTLQEINDNAIYAQEIIDFECEKLDKLIKAYRGDDANWEDEESSSSEDESWDD